MRILFFAPHSAIWIHAFPEALVAESLRRSGNEIIYVGCGGLLSSHCVSMSAYSVPFSAARAQKERICGVCKNNLKIIRDNFGFTGPDLKGLATDDDLAFAEEFISSVPPTSYPELILEGVEVGRVALYEMLIQSKRGALEFDAAERSRYAASLKNVVAVVRLATRMLDEIKPDRIVLYNALYSVNRAVCRLAQMRSIPQYYLHAGDNLSNRLQTLVLARDQAFSYYNHLRDQWPYFENRPCPLDAMKLGTDHLLEVARGRSVWAYSAASGNSTDLRQLLGIGAGQRIICATMSSDDERFGAEVSGVLPSLGGLLYATQVDWIRALIKYVATRQDLCLVIRVHPREFPNKRDAVMSDHAKMLQEALVTLPANVRVNWPTDNISLYDLASITDVFANAWSSAGKEMAWLGLPVVLYSPELALYPTSLNYIGVTELEYFQQIEKALRDGWDVDRIRKTYRWCAVEFFYSSLDISESFTRDEHATFLQKCVRKLLGSVAPSREQKKNFRDRAARLTSAERINRILNEQLNAAVDLCTMDPPAVSYSEETAFLKTEVRRLVDGLYGARNGSRKNSLADKLRSFAES